MPISEPEQITSNRPSNLKNFNEVAQLGHACNSSKKKSVSPGVNLSSGFSNDTFLRMLSTSKPSSKMFLNLGCSTKFIWITFL